ncbi:DUF169 domain-containing protein [Catenulispora rubra]|uniref:DUF169 domain-containing protein n=1 Tax=Catenulispora rubra TaxID=280293 RepID=UPI001892294A|nr:DUF169 domain-containing protein [Catenulispora rubra]
MDHATTAQKLTDLLALSHPPVALAFVETPPEGLAEAGAPVPSACTFWRQAEHGTFYAAAAAHYNCPVGSMVMGFELPAPVNEQLGGLVQSMCDAQYLSMDEAAKIPTVGKNSAGIVYGPLHEFPVPPDLVLLWVNVAQAMIYSEAAGRAAWTSTPMDVTGRPGCAALPLALNAGQPGMSLGCAGMRTFTEIGDELTLAALPGSALDGFLESLAKTVESNTAMRAFYSQHKASITA